MHYNIEVWGDMGEAPAGFEIDVEATAERLEGYVDFEMKEGLDEEEAFDKIYFQWEDEKIDAVFAPLEEAERGEKIL